MAVTRGVLQDLDPHSWREHRFGLPPGRWARLAGRAFWVTGAGTGFGRAISVALALAGARVFLSGRRGAKLAEAIGDACALGASPDGLRPVPVDLTDAIQVAAATETIASDSSSLHGFVHSAAASQRRQRSWPLAEEPAEYLDEILRLNLVAACRVAQAAVGLGLNAGEVRGLFLSSEAGWAFTPGFGHYNVSKAALNSLSGSFAAEYAAHYPALDVQINVLVPGEARTEMNRGSNRSPYAAASMALALLSHPRGGPNAHVFHADGRHLIFGNDRPYERSVLTAERLFATEGLDRTAPASPELIGSLHGYNIVRYRGSFFGIPQALGEIRLEETDADRQHGIIRGNSRDAIEAIIRRDERHRSGT